MGSCLPIHRAVVKNNIILYKDTTAFVPPVTKGQVVKVYDGDTITIASKLPWNNSPLYRFSVRLNGIDTPEIKGSNDDEKELAKIARNLITDMAMNKTVILKNVGTEKFGRLLADVYLEGINLNELLVSKRLAVRYDGGTKISPNSWMKYYEDGSL